MRGQVSALQSEMIEKSLLNAQICSFFHDKLLGESLQQCDFDGESLLQFTLTISASASFSRSRVAKAAA